MLVLTTHDRRGYVETFARAIALDPAVRSGAVGLFVRDDGSTQYGEVELRRLFPRATIVMGAGGLRADFNTRRIFEWFAEQSEYDTMINVDSDAFLDPSWWSFVQAKLPPAGFVTLYHSGAEHHKTLSCNDPEDIVLCEQGSTGALGMVVSKTLAREMLLENDNGGAFDWGIVAWLKKRGIPVLAPKESRVLHFGFFGQNNAPGRMAELAERFNMSSIPPSVRPCVDWWMAAHNPNEPCPHHEQSTPLSDNEVVVLVMSARSDVERRKAIRETWARGHTGVFFMVGDKACAIPPSYRTTAYSCEAKGPVPSDVQTPYDTKVAGEDVLLKDEAEAHSDLVLLPMVDFYRALPRKLKETCRWALAHTEAKWMVKVDDDAVVRIPELEALLGQRDATKLVVMGHIRRGAAVPKSGKWSDLDFIRPQYPPFANGAQGYAVTRGVAGAVVAHDGFEYQGEDVSLGIWMDEMKNPVQWVHSPQHFVAHENCSDRSKVVIGHNISPAKMRACFPNAHLVEDDVRATRPTAPPPVAEAEFGVVPPNDEWRFIHIPKNGGTAIKRAAARQHLPISTSGHEFGAATAAKQTENLLVVLRDPLLRFASAVNYGYKEWVHVAKNTAALAANLTTPNAVAEALCGADPGLRIIADEMISNDEGQKVDGGRPKFNYVFEPQSSWVRDRRDPITVLRFEHLQDDWYDFLDANGMPRAPLSDRVTAGSSGEVSANDEPTQRVFYSAEARRCIQDLYVEDYALLRTSKLLTYAYARAGEMKPVLYHKLQGHLGNQLFQYASVVGIAAANHMQACVDGAASALGAHFENVEKCARPRPTVVVGERGRFAEHQQFEFPPAGAVLEGYLQSYKYFASRAPLALEASIRATASAALLELAPGGVPTVGVHVRRGDIAQKQAFYFVRLPGAPYFERVLAHFRSAHPGAVFVVTSDDPAWCSQQPFFAAADVRVLPRGRAQIADMALLAACDHHVVSAGTFGWWAAFLGAQTGGEVVYYDGEFDMEHPTSKRGVVLADYYPEGWVAMGDAEERTTSRHTIVTAYFDIPSKHASKEYEEWMANMLSLQDAMVIYTTPDMIATIERLRAHAMERTLVVSTKLEDTQMGTRYGATFWETQHALDPERSIHVDPRLYWIWHEKAELVRRTVVSNPFRSSFFAWVDIGYFRTTQYNGKTMIRAIPPTLRKDQVLMLDATTLIDSKRLGNYVGGGFIGGYAEGLEQWHTKYYALLDGHKDEFIGKDQPWMWKTCEANPGLCELVVPGTGHGDPWFYMAPFMMGVGGGHDDNHCLQDLASNMPTNKDGAMKAHHWDARTAKWNEKERWKPMDLKAPCTIWYVGANTHGRDGVRLQQDYPCDIRVFEPVPTFTRALRRNWKDVPRSTIHGYGLGASTRTVRGVHVVGESTFAMEDSKQGVTLEIRSVGEVWREFRSPTIDLLHVNCEGCEWELWESLLDGGLAPHIGTIQVGTHWFPNIVDIERRYCDIESRLKATHEIAFKQAFGWERWTALRP